MTDGLPVSQTAQESLPWVLLRMFLLQGFCLSIGLILISMVI
ncbi:MAG: hypothetical protein WBA57_03845 [Elainellaceae cyanobacterium]